jgi:quercetin dioxygenase-like cupin family protein
MKKKINFLMTAMAVVGLAAFAFPGSAGAQVTGIQRTELQRHDLSTHGREVVQSRIDFDPETAFGKHTHPGEEIIYVLEGLLE